MTAPFVRGMLFDLDGTLADTDPLHFIAWRQSLAAHGVALEEQDYHRQISGRGNPDIIRGFLPDLGAAEVDALADGKEIAYRTLAARLTEIAGLSALLALCKARGLKVGLVTNAPRENAVHVLAALGVTSAFEQLVVAQETPRGKPDPAPYALGLQRLGLRAEEALAFEDSPSGVVSARGAHIRTVGISRAHAPNVLREAGAELVVKDFSEPPLASLLAQLGVAA